jgi:hypothetical protein
VKNTDMSMGLIPLVESLAALFIFYFGKKSNRMALT